MTRTNLFMALPALASVLTLAACIPPSSDPVGEGSSDTEAASDDGATTASSGLEPDGSEGDPAPGPDGDGSAESTGDPAADDGGESESGGSDTEACEPSTHACLSLVPTGWTGPTALAKTTDLGGPAAACDGPFSETLDYDLFAVFDDGGEATCSCNCFPEDQSCTVQASLSYWDPGWGVDPPEACDPTPLGTIVVTEGVTLTNPAWVANPSANWRVNWIDQSLLGSCEPYAWQSIPEATFAKRVTACGLPEEAAYCENGDLCTPRPSGSPADEICIFQEGEHECPAGDYSERKVYYRDIDDPRSCPTCTCGELSGSCTDPHFTPGWYAGDFEDITWANHPISLDASCEVSVIPFGDHNLMSVGAGEPLAGGAFATCGEVAGADVPMGEASPASAVTFCCAAL